MLQLGHADAHGGMARAFMRQWFVPQTHSNACQRESQRTHAAAYRAGPKHKIVAGEAIRGRKRAPIYMGQLVPQVLA